MFIASIPRNVRLALLNEANPIPVLSLDEAVILLDCCSNTTLAEALSSQELVIRFKIIYCWWISCILIHVDNTRLLSMGSMQSFTEESCGFSISFGLAKSKVLPLNPRLDTDTSTCPSP